MSQQPYVSQPQANTTPQKHWQTHRTWARRNHKTWCHPALDTHPSTIDGAGTGVFASQALPAGTHLGYYVGRVHWRYPKRNARDWAYMLRLMRRPPWISACAWRTKRVRGEPVCVDGQGMLSLVNCCRGAVGCPLDAEAREKTHVLRSGGTECARDDDTVASSVDALRVAELTSVASVPNDAWTAVAEDKAPCTAADTRRLQPWNQQNDRHSCNGNCKFTFSGRVLTTQHVSQGQELFFDYGPEYWEDRPPPRRSGRALQDARNEV